MAEATWRSRDRDRSKFPTDMLFHCADAHAAIGLIPNFGAAESWAVVHDRLHAAGQFGNKAPHDHATGTP